MTADLELLEALSSISNDEIEQDRHLYERASEEKQVTFDREIEGLALQRDARERAASIPD